MKKKIPLLISLACVAAFGASFATVLSNKNYSFSKATVSEVPHQIVFDGNDYILVPFVIGKEGLEIRKSNATRSGDSFTMFAYCYGNGGYEASDRKDYLLYCETEGTSELSPNSYFEVSFSIKNIASFVNVRLHGTFYTNRKKTTVTDTMLVDATYDEANHKVSGKAFPFKGYVTSIELNYTCAA